MMEQYQGKMVDSGEIDLIREKQHTVWMWNQIRDNIMQVFKEHPAVKPKIARLEHQVAKGALTSGFAADILLTQFIQSLEKYDSS